MKVALVHDYLTQRGGAERVFLAMCRAFPDAPIYTSLYEPELTFPEFQELEIQHHAAESLRAASGITIDSRCRSSRPPSPGSRSTPT